MLSGQAGYSIWELCAITGFSQTKVQQLVSRTILPRPTGGRRHARYSEEHVRRLKALAKLRDERLTYADLAERWNGEPPRTVQRSARAAVAGERAVRAPGPAPGPAPPAPPAQPPTGQGSP